MWRWKFFLLSYEPQHLHMFDVYLTYPPLWRITSLCAVIQKDLSVNNTEIGRTSGAVQGSMWIQK